MNFSAFGDGSYRKSVWNKLFTKPIAVIYTSTVFAIFALVWIYANELAGIFAFYLVIALSAYFVGIPLANGFAEENAPPRKAWERFAGDNNLTIIPKKSSALLRNRRGSLFSTKALTLEDKLLTGILEGREFTLIRCSYSHHIQLGVLRYVNLCQKTRLLKSES